MPEQSPVSIKVGLTYTDSLPERCTVCNKESPNRLWSSFFQTTLGDRYEKICPDCQARLIFMATDMLREKLQQERECAICGGKGYIDGPDLPIVCKTCGGGRLDGKR